MNIPLPRSLLVALSAAAALHSLAPVAVADIRFAAASRSYDVGGQPYSVVAGDWNGDGRPDLAVSQGQSPPLHVAILFGNPDGTFMRGPDLPSGSGPLDLVRADFDGNGIPDLASANSYSGSISVFMGHGDGTFAPPVNNPCPNCSGLTTGDLNQDGVRDLVACSQWNHTISVYRGHGDGSFDPPVTYPDGSDPMASPGPTSVAIGDFNEDGSPDVVTASPGGQVTLLFGTPSGTLGAPSTILMDDGPRAVATGDLNGDTHLDLAVSEGNSSEVQIFHGRGDGSFESPEALFVGTYVMGVTVADVDQNGCADVLASCQLGTMSLYRSRCDGSFAPVQRFGTGKDPRGIATCDANGDGRMDLFVANWSSGTVSAFLASSDSTWGGGAEIAAGRPAYALAVDDLDGDGRLDLVTSAGAIMWGAPGHTFTDPSVVLPPELQPYGVATGDLNGDGHVDLAFTLQYGFRSNAVSILLGQGNRTFGPRVEYSTGVGPTSVAIGDLDGDAIPDLAVAGYGSNVVSTLKGRGDGTFFPAISHATLQNPFVVAIGDVTGDGYPDLVVPEYGAQRVSIFPSLGGGAFGSRQDLTTLQYPVDAALADLNQDSHLDIVVADYLSASLSIYLGAGGGAFGPRIDVPTGSYPQSVLATDLDADGIPDLASTNRGSQTISLHRGRGDGTFFPRLDLGVGLEPYDICAADLNGDHEPDLAVLNSGSVDATVSLLWNRSAVVVGSPAPGSLLPATAISMSSPHPNPTRDRIGCRVHVPPGKPAFLDLIDLAGRRVHRESIPPTALDGLEIDMRPRGGLRPGVYMLRLRCGDATVAKRVAVLR